MIIFLKRLRSTYTFLANNGCKPSIVGAENDFENEDKNFTDPYIKLTYPCNRLSRWEGPITQSDN